MFTKSTQGDPWGGNSLHTKATGDNGTITVISQNFDKIV